MMFWIKQSLVRQIVFVTVVGIVAWCSFYFLDYAPLVRLSPHMLLMGLIGGGLNVLLLGVLAAIGLAISRTRFRESLEDVRKRALATSIATRVGASITSATGEEFLFRGLAFGMLVNARPVEAFALSIGLAAVSYFRGRKHWYWLLMRMCEAAWLSLLFYQHRSLACVAVARVLSDAVTMSLLIFVPAFFWRQRNVRFNFARDAVRSV